MTRTFSGVYRDVRHDNPVRTDGLPANLRNAVRPPSGSMAEAISFVLVLRLSPLKKDTEKRLYLNTTYSGGIAAVIESTDTAMPSLQLRTWSEPVAFDKSSACDTRQC